MYPYESIVMLLFNRDAEIKPLASYETNVCFVWSVLK